jgi:type IV pilus assembly protein PilQ
MKRAALASSLALALAVSTGRAAAAPPRVSLDVKDADIHNVIRFLADLGKINVVVADDVSGRVTVRLRNVPFETAFRTVLAPKGLGYEELGGVRYIDTEERLTRRAESAAAIAADRQRNAPLRTIIIPVSNARAEDLAPLVRSHLSLRGRVEVDMRTNTLIVTDVAPE